jgi:PKD repeat protein
VPLWTNRFNGPGSGEDQSKAVAVDGSNNVIVTGYSTGSGSGYDYTTIKYSSAGMPLWTNRYNGPGNTADTAYAVAVDRTGNVIVTGASIGSGGNFDFATVKYFGPPVAGFTADRTNGVGPLTVLFTNLSASATDYAWIFGDGNLSTNVQPANTYTEPGVYTVTLRAVGPGGTNALTRTNYIVVLSVPPVLTSLSPTNGTFQLRADDLLQPGTLVIEAASNLAGWVPVFTNTTPTNVLFYTDPEASSNPARFYRAFQSP